MRGLMTLFLVCFDVVFFQGYSSVSQAGYDWGDYSQTYLAVVRTPSSENTTAHIAELREILAVSKEKELKPPPGICAELAFYLAQPDGQGEQSEIDQLYQCEMDTYPESRRFVERLINLDA